MNLKNEGKIEKLLNLINKVAHKPMKEILITFPSQFKMHLHVRLHTPQLTMSPEEESQCVFNDQESTL